MEILSSETVLFFHILDKCRLVEGSHHQHAVVSTRRTVFLQFNSEEAAAFATYNQIEVQSSALFRFDHIIHDNIARQRDIAGKQMMQKFSSLS